MSGQSLRSKVTTYVPRAVGRSENPGVQVLFGGHNRIDQTVRVHIFKCSKVQWRWPQFNLTLESVSVLIFVLKLMPTK